jgi:tetratricopeptide (TPR) repeat protein
MRDPDVTTRPGGGARCRSWGDGAAFSRGAGRWRRRAIGLLAVAASVGLTGCRDAETALARGDRLWADSNYTAALAEYRLAFEIRAGSDEVLVRLAHAYARTNQFEQARESYDRLLQRAPHYADQAVFDYLALAQQAQARGDRYGLAGAVEAALALRPGLPVGDMSVPLARYYARTGERERAQDFFERALGHAPPDSVPGLLFEFAQFQESQGNCREAIELYNAFRTRQPRGERADQARWNVGNCAFRLGREARQGGDPSRALSHLQVMLDLGVPQNLLDQAWLERGEALLDLGRREEALNAYVRALEHVRTPGSGQLADRARQRIDQIRFGTDIVP